MDKPPVSEQIAASIAAVMGTLQSSRAAPDVSALEAEVARLNNEVLVLSARIAALEVKVS